uniref:Uncharacterized protein n=1 Tax=Ditylenchus dipsaci TaxID=166011 RepID=A0A915DND7_9BILA
MAHHLTNQCKKIGPEARKTIENLAGIKKKTEEPPASKVSNVVALHSHPIKPHRNLSPAISIKSQRRSKPNSTFGQFGRTDITYLMDMLEPSDRGRNLTQEEVQAAMNLLSNKVSKNPAFIARENEEQQNRVRYLNPYNAMVFLQSSAYKRIAEALKQLITYDQVEHISGTRSETNSKDLMQNQMEEKEMVWKMVREQSQNEFNNFSIEPDESSELVWLQNLFKCKDVVALVTELLLQQHEKSWKLLLDFKASNFMFLHQDSNDCTSNLENYLRRLLLEHYKPIFREGLLTSVETVANRLIDIADAIGNDDGTKVDTKDIDDLQLQVRDQIKALTDSLTEQMDNLQFTDFRKNPDREDLKKTKRISTICLISPFSYQRCSTKLDPKLAFQTSGAVHQETDLTVWG